MEQCSAESLPFAITEIQDFAFRRFERLAFEPGRFNVIIGVNGSGKSSILSAISIMLSRLTTRITSGKSGGHLIGLWDITNDWPASSLLLRIKVRSLEYAFSLSRSRAGRVVPTRQHAIDLNVARVNGDIAQLPGGVADVASVFRDELTKDKQSSLPVAVIYPVNRAVIDIPLRIRKRHSFDQFSAYEGALSGTSNFRTFFEWFREREDIENEKRVEEADYRDPLLKAVREAILAFMPEYQSLRVRRNPLRMTIQKDDGEVLINQLSDGEKALLSLIGDLARRLAIANPSLDKPLEGAGVVMIDEIELHLHPRWQRHAVEQLPIIFPNLQFFLTTHSAVVANSAQPGSVFALRDGAVESIDAFGQDVSVVLEDIFGTSSRPLAVQVKIDHLFATIEEDLEGAEPLLAQLQEELSAQDEVVVRAMARIARRKR